jgi:hypothetical protein
MKLVKINFNQTDYAFPSNLIDLHVFSSLRTGGSSPTQGIFEGYLDRQ